MPLSFRYDSVADVMFVTASGVLTDGELREGILRVLDDKAFHSKVRIFEDFTSVDEFRVSKRTIAELCSHERVVTLRGRYAQLIFSPKGSMLLADSLVVVDSARFGRFYKRQEALDWLNQGMKEPKIISFEASLPSPSRRPS